MEKKSLIGTQQIIYSKNIYILPKYLHYHFKVYNGKKLIDLIITKEMFFHRIGEFIPTRIKHIFRKKKRKGKK